MSFNAIVSRPCTRGSEVSISLRRRDGNTQPRLYVSVDIEFAKQSLGWVKGDYVTAHFGSGPDAGKVRLAPLNSGLGGTALKLQGKGAGANRFLIRIEPWFDFRGIRLPARPVDYKADPRMGFLDVDLPAEIANLPQLRAVV